MFTHVSCLLHDFPCPRHGGGAKRGHVAIGMLEAAGVDVCNGGRHSVRASKSNPRSLISFPECFGNDWNTVSFGLVRFAIGLEQWINLFPNILCGIAMPGFSQVGCQQRKDFSQLWSQFDKPTPSLDSFGQVKTVANSH